MKAVIVTEAQCQKIDELKAAYQRFNDNPKLRADATAIEAARATLRFRGHNNRFRGHNTN